MPTQIWSFVVVAALIIVIPGADMMLVANNTISRGRSAGFRTVAGAGLGLGLHACGAIAGLSAIIAASAAAFSVVKLAGALFLVWLGLTTLWAARPGSSEGPAATAPSDTRTPSRDPLLQGFLTNVLNPKLSIFFLSFLPQFVSGDSSATPQIILLSGVFVTMGAVWLSFYVMAVDSLSGLLQRRSVEIWMGRFVGTALVGLGLRLALASSD